MEGLYYDAVETPLGWMGLLGSPRGLRRTTLPQESPDLCLQLLGPEAPSSGTGCEELAPLREGLALYFEGAPVSFLEHPLDLGGAPRFLRAAWAACRTIPIGETRSYKWLADEAGRPNASRAAGQSMARNRLPIVIPCHRVVASDGGLGGFGRRGSQLDLKRRLLELEARHGPNHRLMER